MLITDAWSESVSAAAAVFMPRNTPVWSIPTVRAQSSREVSSIVARSPIPALFTTAAVGVTLMWAFVIEGIVPVVLRTPEIATWLPRGAIQDLLNTQTTQLSLGAAGALIVGYAAALVVATD